jgi:catechol 2,3-dioxygenase-like lactoylglutathione lyase family enzyme
MQSGFSHIQFNVRPENIPFYTELMDFLGWRTLFAGDGFLGVAGKHGESFWFVGGAKEVANDYDGPGVNHIAIGAEAQGDVDAAAEFLTGRGVALLFDTPRHRPDFPQGEGRTYYQIMFETPDRMLIEFVYIGPTAA